MNNETFVRACQDIIDKYEERTECDYHYSMIELQHLYDIAQNVFQETCVKAALCRLWEPHVHTLVSLFE